MKVKMRAMLALGQSLRKYIGAFNSQVYRNRCALNRLTTDSGMHVFANSNNDSDSSKLDLVGIQEPADLNLEQQLCNVENHPGDQHYKRHVLLNIVPIASLTPNQTKWTIKAHVTHKGDILEWKNARSEGRFFNFIVLDASGDILVTCFNEEIDKFYDTLEAGKAYYISDAVLKRANRRHNSTAHNFDAVLRQESQISPCDKSVVTDLPEVHYNFIPISELADHVSQLVDVIGVLKYAGDVATVTIRNHNRITKVRKLHIVDKSGAGVQLYIWGDEADKFDCNGNPVIALKSIRVSDYGGCSLSTRSSSLISRDPDIPEASELKQWFQTGGWNETVRAMTQSCGVEKMVPDWKTLSKIKQENLGMGDSPDYIKCKCTVLYCRRKILYKSCPAGECKKKVIELQDGHYHCVKCDKTSTEFKYRMIFSMNIGDETDTAWVTCSQEQGEILLGMKTDELGALSDGDEAKYEEILKKLYSVPYLFHLRIKSERHNDEKRRRCTVVNVCTLQ